jgi:hypothetical protein
MDDEVLSDVLGRSPLDRAAARGDASVEFPAGIPLDRDL